MPDSHPPQFPIADALLGAWATNNRINSYLIENVPDEAWRAKPPGGKGRDIASMFGHMHNVRIMWIKSADKSAKLPAKLEGDDYSKKDAVNALAESERALDAILRRALSGDGRISGFKPDAASFLAYLFAHDAHHRGQICMLARQVGHPISKSAGFGLWEWGTR
ncbi:MAG TPA: DinB family protein [Bryobacteraceae bacterium]|nr:DinB family protein [Bryobacteraceae bacterium]